MTAMQYMELLYEKFYRKLYLYALALVSDENEARDIVSEVMATIWQRLNQHNTQPNATYLYTLTRNRCLDYLRHTQAAQNYKAAEAVARTFQNDTEVEDYETYIIQLYDAIGQLPEPGQTILRHCYFKRLTYRQTAEALGITEAMVHRHMVKVFKLLREKLKNN